MPIPDYESLMVPLLKVISDEKEHDASEVSDILSDEFHLSPEEKSERLPSGKPVIYSRVHWAKTYLKNAGLLESTGWGKYRITARGKEVLDTKPNRIDGNFLAKFPEFVAFRQRSRKTEPRQAGGEQSETPEERLESSYQHLRDALAQELLERVKAAPPKFFEQLVVDLLVSMGYGGSRKDAGEAVGRSNDGGIDGIIKEDKLGLDKVYIQAKRWDSPVGRPIAQKFVGSLDGLRASKGILITTSKFADPAIKYVDRVSKNVILIDGDTLAQFIVFDK